MKILIGVTTIVLVVGIVAASIMIIIAALKD